jgi:hypothetical protein
MQNVSRVLECMLEGCQTRMKNPIVALVPGWFCTLILESHYAFEHSEASIRSSLMEHWWGLTSFLALLKTLSHSADIAGIERVSKAV